MTSPFRARRIARHLTYANVVATLALLIAIGGGSAYAASRLITGRQIARHSITAVNIKDKSLTGAVFKRGTLRTGATGATGPAGPAGPAGATGAPGSAKAYGIIAINGAGNPYFAPGSAGFTTVYAPASGDLCIAPPAGVSADDSVLLVENAGGEGGDWQNVSPGQCGGTGYEVSDNFGGSGGNLTDQLIVAVP